MLKKTVLFLISALFVFGISKISPAMTCCGDHAQAQAAQVDESGNKKESINVGNKICPVSGEKIGEGMKPVTYEYKGKIYNLCCEMCIEKFKKDPDKYIKIIEGEKAP